MRDQVSGLFWLAISILVCVKSLHANIGTFGRPGAGFLPFWSGCILGTLSIILVVGSLLKKSASGDIAHLWKGMEWGRVVSAFISLFIYGFFLERLGYLIATFWLIIVMLGIIGRPKVWVLVVSALIVVLVTYVVFDVWLEVRLPRGIFSL
jgi:hypothetical protein